MSKFDFLYFCVYYIYSMNYNFTGGNNMPYDDIPDCLIPDLDQSPDTETLDPGTLFFFTDDTPTCKDY